LTTSEAPSALQQAITGVTLSVLAGCEQAVAGGEQAVGFALGDSVRQAKIAANIAKLPEAVRKT
jgi:hypothetical protein